MKALTRDQIQSRKDQAVRFTRDVLDDPDRAAEIEDEPLEDYAERRKFTITNSKGQTRRTHTMADGKTKAELEAEIEDLEAENQELQDQLDAIADIAGGGGGDEDEDRDDIDDGTGDDDQD